MPIKRAIAGIFFSLIFLAVFAYVIFGANLVFKKYFTASIIDSAADIVEQTVMPQKKDQAPAININAKAAISVFASESGREEVLFQKNEQEVFPVASLSKLVTALVVLDNYDLAQKVEISESASKLEESRPARVLKNGDIFSVDQLLNLMLVESNSTAAHALSEVADDAKFAELMNAKAREIGMDKTVFDNAVGRGLTNFSTVTDIAKLLKFISKNSPQILKISNQKEYILQGQNNNFLRKANNTNELVGDANFGTRIIGGKTGETADAGECLALVVEPLAGSGYIFNVLLNSDDRFGEMKKIISWDDAAYFWQPAKTEPDKGADAGRSFDPFSLTWTEAVKSAPWAGRDSHAVTVYKDKIWLMGGLNANGHVASPGNVDYNSAKYFSDVWSSNDGVNWNLVLQNSPWGERRSVQLVEFKGKMWLIGGYSPDYGYKNDVWSTEDGVNWKEEIASAAWPVREGHNVIVFQDKLWLLGGVRYDKNIAGSSNDTQRLFNDVWYSADGINWSEATPDAGWSPRWDDSVAVFQNKLWLSGGMIFGSTMYNDVWYSEDGVNWVQATGYAPFAPRQGNILTEYKGKLWMIGRLDGVNGGLNDVWFSEDGVNWQKTKNDPAWLGREDNGAVIFREKIWILGGMDKNWVWRNDIWYSKF